MTINDHIFRFQTAMFTLFAVQDIALSLELVLCHFLKCFSFTYFCQLFWSEKMFFQAKLGRSMAPYNLEIKNLTQCRGSFTNIRSVSKCASLDSAIAVVQCRRRPILPLHNELESFLKLIYSEKDTKIPENLADDLSFHE